MFQEKSVSMDLSTTMATFVCNVHKVQTGMSEKNADVLQI